MIINAIRDKIREYSSMKKSAFTVAEVLIALVVLGVIASAVTGVVYFSKNGGEFQNRDLVATLQSQVIKLNRSYKIALTENDDLDRWVYRVDKDEHTKHICATKQYVCESMEGIRINYNGLWCDNKR